MARPHRGAGEPDERHFAFYSVAGERDGLEDVTQLLVHVHFGAQTLQVLGFLQGLRECGTFASYHLDLHTHGLRRRRQSGSLYSSKFAQFCNNTSENYGNYLFDYYYYK